MIFVELASLFYTFIAGGYTSTAISDIATVVEQTEEAKKSSHESLVLVDVHKTYHQVFQTQHIIVKFADRALIL